MQAITCSALNSKKKNATGRLTITHFASDSQTGQQLLLKTLRFPSDIDFSLLIQTQDFLKSVKSPYLVQTVGYETETKSRCFKLAVERMDSSLADLIATEQTCPFSEELIEKSLCGIVDVLKEAQSRGIAHGQITAENCFCSGKDTGIRIGNFSFEQENPALLREVPKRYLSPEARNWMEDCGKEGLDCYRTDVFALGVVFLQVIHWETLEVLDAHPSEAQSLLDSLQTRYPRVTKKLRVMLKENRPDFQGLQQAWQQRDLCKHCFKIVEGSGIREGALIFCSESCQEAGRVNKRVEEPLIAAQRPRSAIAACQKCKRPLQLQSEQDQTICLSCKHADELSSQPKPVLLQTGPKPAPIPRTFPPAPAPASSVEVRPQVRPSCGLPSSGPFSCPAAPDQPNSAICVICQTTFIASPNAPHPSHTAEVLDFCSPACKDLWINMEFECDYGRNTQDDSLFCMTCGMVPVHALPLGCENASHVFCSRGCAEEFVRWELRKNGGEGRAVRCPHCNTYVPREIVAGWAVPQRRWSEHPLIIPSLPEFTCVHCKQSQFVQRMPCGHSLCERCFQANSAICPTCGPHSHS